MSRKPFDPIALAKQVNCDVGSDNLTMDFLKSNQTVYDLHPDYPNMIRQITPDRRVTFGKIVDGKFQAIFCALEKFK